MEEKEMVLIEDSNGTSQEVELVTYLISEDSTKTYIVYTKGEKQEEDQIIYISKLIKEDDKLKINEITEDSEWTEVQHLLKKIANT